MKDKTAKHCSRGLDVRYIAVAHAHRSGLPGSICLQEIALAALYMSIFVILHAPVRAVVRASTPARALRMRAAAPCTSVILMQITWSTLMSSGMFTIDAGL